MITETSYIPNSRLSQFVDFIWIGKASNMDLESTHHAALFTELIFNYGDDFQVNGQNVENVVSKHNHQIISGLKREPFKTKVSGTYESIGLILKPFCYGMLIGKFGTKLMDQISEMLYESLFDCKKPDFESVECNLLRLFGKQEIDSDLIKFEKYISSSLLEKGVLNDFNLSISISQKSFIQKFKKYYLLTPNDYLKLKKVNSAVQLLQDKKSQKLIEVGLDSGFYDQSHFIKVFKKFSGLTPKEFIKSNLG